LHNEKTFKKLYRSDVGYIGKDPTFPILKLLQRLTFWLVEFAQTRLNSFAHYKVCTGLILKIWRPWCWISECNVVWEKKLCCQPVLMQYMDAVQFL